MIKFDVLSIFPEMFASPLNFSLLKKAQEKSILNICLHDIRNWADDKHKMTDDAPYGGGCGMVMKVEPVEKALAAIRSPEDDSLVVLMTPQGKTFNQKIAAELAEKKQIIIICGRYEGVDERIREHLVDWEISIGDYILTGGELAALVLIDAVSRLIPDVWEILNQFLVNFFLITFWNILNIRGLRNIRVGRCLMFYFRKPCAN